MSPMGEANVTPMLGVGEQASNFGSAGYRCWIAELFPFEGKVSKYETDSAFEWRISWFGAGTAAEIASGRAATWSEAFDAVGGARRAALESLSAQLVAAQARSA